MMKVPANLTLEKIRLERARRSLEAFTCHTMPEYEVNWHHKLICRYLDDFVAGKIKRLMINVAPRMGKSELCSRRLPAYIFGKDPNKKIISVSYGADLASRMNRDVQRIITNPKYKEVFPNTKLWEKNVVTVADGSYLRNSTLFEIVNNKGSYQCSGVGGSLTGTGAGIIIIDDPIKNAEEALSKVYRDKIWDFYTSTLYTRLEKDGQILLIMTRWNHDDLAGRLLKLAQKDPKAEQWTVLTLPTIKENNDNPEDPREIGEPIWPNKYNAETIEKMKITMGTRDWNSLHRQQPTSETGDIFKRHWWRFYKRKDLPFRFDNVTISCDMAFKNKESSDYVVMQVWGKLGVKYYMLDQVRDRLSFLQTVKALSLLVLKWPNYSECLIEDKANGTAIINTLEDKIPAIVAVSPKESKVARASSCSPLVEAGNVYLPHKDECNWVDDFVEELASFPKAAHDDQCFSPMVKILTTQNPTEGIYISQVKEGDLVLTPTGYNRVLEVFENPPAKILNLEFSDGSTLSCTDNHPIYLPDRKIFIEAKLLKVDDKLLGIKEDINLELKNTLMIVSDVETDSGEKQLIPAIVPMNVDTNKCYKDKEIVGISYQEKKEKVYNLKVEGNPSFFANGVLVHNCDAFSQYLNKSSRSLGWADHLMGQIDEVESTPMGEELKQMFWPK